MRRTTYVTACSVAVLSFGLSACSSDAQDDPTASTTSSPTDSAAPSESTASSATDPTSPSASASPSVTPASGLQLDTGSTTFNLPDGWKDNKNGYPHTYSGSPKKGLDIRLITAIDLNAASGYTLDERAQDALTQLPGSKLTRRPDIELDGAPAYHIAGTAPVRGHVRGIRDRLRGPCLQHQLQPERPVGA